MKKKQLLLRIEELEGAVNTLTGMVEELRVQQKTGTRNTDILLQAQSERIKALEDRLLWTPNYYFFGGGDVAQVCPKCGAVIQQNTYHICGGRVTSTANPNLTPCLACGELLFKGQYHDCSSTTKPSGAPRYSRPTTDSTK